MTEPLYLLSLLLTLQSQNIYKIVIMLIKFATEPYNNI